MFTLRSSFSRAFSSVKPGQKFMVFFGAPGVGKGTYAQLMAKDLKLNQISTGDEIRKILKNQAHASMSKDLIEQIKKIVNSGGLVDDDIVFKILQEKLKEPESQNGVILDGFPRTLAQLQKYDKLYPTHLVINLTLRNDVLVEKLMGRRTCVGCGKSYNICSIKRDGYDMDPLNPKKEGVCDKCSGKLVIRDDDKKEVIEARMKEYEAKTHPLLNEYSKKGVLMNFEAKRGVKDYAALLDLVKPKLDKVK